MTTITEEPLYHRLGGYDAVARVIGNLYHRLLRHHHAWYYWKGCGHDVTTEQRRFSELVCISTGGPAAHPGRDTQPTHDTPGIGKVEMGIFVGVAAETLSQSGLEEREQEELFLALARSKAALTPAQPASAPTNSFAGYAPGLTHREREVLRLMALGKSNAEIAGELCISINTVTRHLTNIFLKTDTRNRVEAAVYAVRHNIL